MVSLESTSILGVLSIAYTYRNHNQTKSKVQISALFHHASMRHLIIAYASVSGRNYNSPIVNQATIV